MLLTSISCNPLSNNATKPGVLDSLEISNEHDRDRNCGQRFANAKQQLRVG